MSRIGLLSTPLVGIAAIIINAPLATIREGTLPLAKPRPGSSVSPGETLGEIKDSRADGTRLHDLERTKTDLTAELAKTNLSLPTSKMAHADFVASASRYQQGRIQQLTVQLNQEQAGREAANAWLVDLNNNFVRAKNLNECGIQNVAHLDHARIGSSRMWLKDLSCDGARLRGVSARVLAFRCISY